jgi:hypothetical protein
VNLIDRTTRAMCALDLIWHRGTRPDDRVFALSANASHGFGDVATYCRLLTAFMEGGS